MSYRLSISVAFALALLGCSGHKDITLKGEATTKVDVEVPKESPAKLSTEQKRKIREYLEVFYSGDREKWRQAKTKLVAMGPLAVQALCIFMIKFFAAGRSDGTQNAGVYWAVAKRELIEIGEPAVPYLILVMAHPKMGTTGRMQCSQALVAIGSPAVPELLKNLESGDRSFRRLLLDTLANIGDPRAAGPIAELYLKLPKPDSEPQELEDDPSFDQRYYCMKALGKLGAEAGLPAIRKALEDPVELVRRAAIVAVAVFRSPAALPALKEASELAKKDYPSYYKVLQRQIATIENAEEGSWKQ